ncbi:MAG: tetratricopeptide repeat protein, partial [Terracidiphilus sp.]
MRRWPRAAQVLLAALVAASFFASSVAAQAPAPAAQGRILLVLPFENRTGLVRLEWIREAASEILTERLSSAGFSPLSRADRVYALDHLGLPENFQPSRASSLKLAETLDAGSIVVGDYQSDGSVIQAEVRIVDVPHLKMGPAVTAKGEMHDLAAVFGSLAWKLTRQLDPSFSVAEETFAAAGSGLRLEAFEQYIRGITEPDQAERLHHLRQAVGLGPDFGPAWMALGSEQYAAQQYEQAAESFARAAKHMPQSLEASFYRGLALMFSGDYTRAEEAFGAVARRLPLAEVLNNQGVALVRRGKDGLPLFRQAVAADPNDPDYHFNLAVGLKHRGETAEALKEIAECRKLRPADAEAEAVEDAWTGKKSAPEVTGGDQPAEPAQKVDPLERIKRSFDAQAFRQAAAMLDQMDAARLAALNPHERALALAAQALDDLNHDLLLEAERLSLAAVAAENTVAAGHVGLAEV